MTHYNLFLKRDMSRANTAPHKARGKMFGPTSGPAPTRPLYKGADAMPLKSVSHPLPDSMVPQPAHEGVVLVGDVWSNKRGDMEWRVDSVKGTRVSFQVIKAPFDISSVGPSKCEASVFLDQHNGHKLVSRGAKP